MAWYKRRGVEMTGDSFELLRGWVGKKEVRSDSLTAWPIAALAATLDEPTLAVDIGSPVPNGWHWIFFLEAKPASELGSDGHPKRGGFLPPVPLPRRMWAGSRIAFQRPLTIGSAVTRLSRIADVSLKEGKTGPLVFVRVRHEISDEAGIAIVDE